MISRASFRWRPLLVLAGLLTTLLLLVPLLQARVYVEINQPGQKPFNLAIPAFKNLGRTSPPQPFQTQFVDIITDDLRLTGLFNILDPKSFLEDPLTHGLLPEQTDFAAWQQIDALGLAKGGFELKGSTLSVQLRVFDVMASAQIGGKAYTGQPKDVRRLAHQMASEIVYLFTGQRGFFGSKIVAVNDASGNKEIVLLDVDGHNRIQLSNNRSINLLPTFSARGNLVGFTSYKSGNPDLYGADLVRGLTRRISSFSGLNAGAAWAPDGSAIALTLSKDGDPEIYLIDESGKELARLTRSFGVDSSPAWSPDGSKLAFVSSRAGGAHIFIMNRDGSNVRRLTHSGSQNVSPAWSPKGDRLAFSGRDSGAFDIFVTSLDGQRIVRVTQDQGNNEDPAWSPDGNYLVYSSTRSGKKPQLYIGSADGRSQVRITEGPGGFTNPDWSNFVDW